MATAQVQTSALDRAKSSLDLIWLAGMSIAFALALLPFSSYATLLPAIQEQWQMSNTVAGLVFSAHFVGSAAAALLIVPLTDRWAPQYVMSAGLFLLVGANLLFPLLAGGVWSAALLRFVAGMGHIAALNPAIRAVSERFHQRRGAAVGIFVGAGFAGTTLSYTVTGLFLGASGDWQTAYLQTALLGVIGFALALPFALLPIFRRPAPSLPAEPAVSASGRGRLDLSVLRERPVTLITAAYALHTAELYLARLWFPLLLAAALTASGMDGEDAAVRAPVLAGAMFALGILGTVVGGWLSDPLGRVLAAILLFAGSGLCSFAAGWLADGPIGWLIVLGFAYGLLTAADSAIYSTAVIELAPPGRIGSAQAVQSTVGFTLGAAVPILAGAILDASDDWGWIIAFGFNGLLAVAGVACLLWLRRLPTTKPAP
jgi:MFS family permease